VGQLVDPLIGRGDADSPQHLDRLVACLLAAELLVERIASMI